MPQGVSISLESREYRWRWWALVGASLAVFMAALDNNVVNVALPILARNFQVDRQIRWVALAYILPGTALLGAFGALSDALGRRRITLLGVSLFLLGSVLCGTARSLEQMILYRIIQGTGAAAVGSAVLAIATVNFAPEERGRAMSVIGLIAPLGAVVGPSLGGLLIGLLGWPSIFYINVPVGLVALVLIYRLLPKDTSRMTKGFDVPGASLFTAALVLLILGLNPGDGRMRTPEVLMLVGAAAALGGLLLVERRARNPLVPLSLVSRRHFTIPAAGIMTFAIVGTALGFILPFFLEGVQGLGPERTGLTLLFFPLAMAVTSQIGGRLTDRFNPRLPAAVGAAISLIGVALFLPMSAAWRPLDVALRGAVVGFGFGFFISPSAVAVMAAAPRDHIGVGGALLNTARFLGFALGPTLATVFWTPGVQGVGSLTSMRTVVLVVVVVQVLTLATVLAYRVSREERQAKPSVETTAA
ncbi:MAG TPA: MFS transporter [Spirochaetia bacterium]|nr:MFS transporter [Spirochaetia bacterium]